MSWPKQVVIPRYIGKDTYVNNDAPCCAVGHFLHQLRHKTKLRQNYALLTETSPELTVLEGVYKALYAALFGKTYRSQLPTVERINDRINTKDRRTLYLLTWAKLGYTEGMPKRILNLLQDTRVQAVTVPI